MIPDYEISGNLPPGVHWATWDEIVARFGTTPWRRDLLNGLRSALDGLRRAGCRTVYLDGSFVTDKQVPGDFDACWDEHGVDVTRIDPVLLNFDNGRADPVSRRILGAHKFRRRVLTVPASKDPSWTARMRGDVFLDFFQIDKETGQPKGIVALDLGGIR